MLHIFCENFVKNVVWLVDTVFMVYIYIYMSFSVNNIRKIASIIESFLNSEIGCYILALKIPV